jgi:hypothetical protein
MSTNSSTVTNSITTNITTMTTDHLDLTAINLITTLPTCTVSRLLR